jgi:inorganic pyrophosphatase
VLVLIDAPTFVGCLVTTRLIGVLQAQQRERRRLIRNDRLIGVPETPVNKPEISSIDELAEQTLAGIENFFVAYNRAQGREFRVRGRLGPRGAERLLREALRH